MKGKFIVSTAMFLLISAFFILSVQPLVCAQITEVKIGWSWPLSGPIDYKAYLYLIHYVMVIDDFNNMSGLYVPEVGRRVPITYLVLDDEYDIEKCYSNYLYLVEEWGADLLFAPYSTAFIISIKPIFEKYQYSLVALTVSLEIFQHVGNPYLFTVLANPTEIADGLAGVFEFINSKVPDAIKIDEVGIAYRDDEHGIAHAEAIKNALEAIGISVSVYEPYYPFGVIDWAVIVDAFRSADVDVCIVCGYDEVAGFVWQCITENYNPKLIVSGPTLGEHLLVYYAFGFNPGLMAGIVCYNAYPTPGYNSPKYPEFYPFVKKYRNYTEEFLPPYGLPPFPESAVYYAGVEALLRATEIAGLTNRTGIRDELEYRTFKITLGLNTTIATFKFRRGQSPLITKFGLITQWTGEGYPDVVWPIDQHSYRWIIYPMFPWSWGKVPDINRDGKVDLTDIVAAIRCFGWRGPLYECRGDVDYNGKVDLKDIVRIISYFGSMAPFGGIVPLPDP